MRGHAPRTHGPIQSQPISVVAAVKEIAADMAQFGVKGVFRGQGIGIVKAIVSLTLFHEGRMGIARHFRETNTTEGRWAAVV